MFKGLRRNEIDITINTQRAPCKVPVILVRFQRTLDFSTDFRESLKYNFNKNLSNGSRLFHADRWADREM